MIRTGLGERGERCGPGGLAPRPSGALRRCVAVMGAAILLGCGAAGPERVPLRLVERRTVAEDAGERMEALSFTDPRGDSVTAYLRRPVGHPDEALGGVILVAGRETGRRAARVVPGPLGAAVLAVEYPAALPQDLDIGSVLYRLPEIREEALRVPGVLREAARFLAAEPDVDPGRIALVGVSFGVPFAAMAGDDPIFRGVALHHGGGDLVGLLDANLPIQNSFLRSVASHLLGWYLRPLDPAHHVDDIAPRPLLLINGTLDTSVPRSSVLELVEEAEGPVRLVWLPHEHLMPGDTAVMRELADSTVRHFEFLAPEEGSSRP